MRAIMQTDDLAFDEHTSLVHRPQVRLPAPNVSPISNFKLLWDLRVGLQRNDECEGSIQAWLSSLDPSAKECRLIGEGLT